MKVHGVHELNTLSTTFDDSNSPFVWCVEYGDSVYETFEHFWKNKEDSNAGYFSIFREIYKRKQSELSNKIDLLQMSIHNLQVSMCTLEEKLFSRSHRAQLREAWTKS